MNFVNERELPQSLKITNNISIKIIRNITLEETGKRLSEIVIERYFVTAVLIFQ